MNRIIPADIQAMGLRGEIEDLRAKLVELQEENARLRDLLEEATSYTNSPAWSPSLTEEIEKELAARKEQK